MLNSVKLPEYCSVDINVIVLLIKSIAFFCCNDNIVFGLTVNG